MIHQTSIMPWAFRLGAYEWFGSKHRRCEGKPPRFSSFFSKFVASLFLFSYVESCACASAEIWVGGYEDRRRFSSAIFVGNLRRQISSAIFVGNLCRQYSSAIFVGKLRRQSSSAVGNDANYWRVNGVSARIHFAAPAASWRSNGSGSGSRSSSGENKKNRAKRIQ